MSMLIGASKTDINTLVNAAFVSDDYKSGISIYGSTRQFRISSIVFSPILIWAKHAMPVIFTGHPCPNRFLWD